MIKSFGQATGKIITYSHRAVVPWVLLSAVVWGAFILRAALHAHTSRQVVQHMLAGLVASGVLTGIVAYFALRIEVTRAQIVALTLVPSAAISLILAYYLLVPWDMFNVESAAKLFGLIGVLWPVAIYIFLAPALLLAGRVKG